MLKKFSVALLMLISAGMLFAVEIDTSLLDEAKKVTYRENYAKVSWRNFNTGKQIRDMGRTLGRGIVYQEQVAKEAEPMVSGAPSYKYRAARIYSGDLAGADVLYINKNAKVDTTKCLFRVVSGYIEKAYDIPMAQADKIAKKVCWWNNNHYNEKDYFTEHFDPKVLEAFNEKTDVIGLAASYKYWPGKTRIVIPFVFVKEEAPATVEPAPVEETPAEPEPVAEPVPEVKTSTGNHWVLLGVLLAVLLILIVVLVIVLTRMHRNRE